MITLMIIGAVLAALIPVAYKEYKRTKSKPYLYTTISIFAIIVLMFTVVVFI